MDPVATLRCLDPWCMIEVRGTLGILMYIARWIFASGSEGASANTQLRVKPYSAIGGMSKMIDRMMFGGTPTQKRLAQAMRGMPTSAAELMPCVRDVLARHPLRVVVPNVQEGMQFVDVTRARK